MIRAAFLSVIGLALAVPAAAQEIPAPGVYDTRVRMVDYNSEQVFVLRIARRSALLVQMSESETVENIAVGDSVS